MTEPDRPVRQRLVAILVAEGRVPKATSIAAIKAWMHPSASLVGYEPLYQGLRRAGVAD